MAESVVRHHHHRRPPRARPQQRLTTVRQHHGLCLPRLCGSAWDDPILLPGIVVQLSCAVSQQPPACLAYLYYIPRATCLVAICGGPPQRKKKKSQRNCTYLPQRGQHERYLTIVGAAAVAATDDTATYTYILPGGGAFRQLCFSSFSLLLGCLDSWEFIIVKLVRPGVLAASSWPH